MTSLDRIQSFSPLPLAEPTDFVSRDIAALASHMNSCASTRGRFFGVYAALESAHGAVCARLVTAAVAGLIVLGVIGLI